MITTKNIEEILNDFWDESRNENQTRDKNQIRKKILLKLYKAENFRDMHKIIYEQKIKYIDTYFCNVFMKLLSKNHREWSLVDEIYNILVKYNSADVFTFNYFIAIAGKNGRLEKAKKAFEEAKNKKLANVVTYSSFIVAAGNNSNFEEAKKAFEEAKNKKLVDVVTYNNIIDITITYNQVNTAKQIFDNIWKNYFMNENVIDFHNHSFGVAILILDKIITSNEKNNIKIVPGTGSHSKNNESVILNILEKLDKKYPGSIERESDNKGVCYFNPQNINNYSLDSLIECCVPSNSRVLPCNDDTIPDRKLHSEVVCEQVFQSPLTLRFG
jgi:pentatricopeptide repeat protein